MLRLWPLLGVFAFLAVLAFACNGGGAGTTPTPTASPASPAATASPQASACPSPSGTPPEPATKTYQERPPMSIDPAKKHTAIVKTVRGDLTIELLPDIAPETVNSFVFLARDGYYDGVTFHRVIPGFVAQGGDPTGTGSGGPGYTLPAEFSDVPFERGTVAMARTNDPDSAGSQFFIAYDDQPDLDGQFTVFGQVVEGMDVVDCLTPRDPAADPNAPPGDAMISIEIEEEE